MTLSLIAPLLAGLLGLAAVHLQASLPPWPLCLGLLGASLLAWPFGRFLPARLMLAVLAAAVAAYGYGNLRAHLALAEELSAEWEGRDIAVVGLIASLPQASAGMFGSEGWRFQFQVETSLTEAAPVPSHVLLSWYGQGEGASLPKLRVGDRWRFTVRLRRPHGLLNPHGFDHELWLLEQGLRATGTVRPGAQLLGRAAAFPVDRWRQALRDAIDARVEDRRSAGVLAALSLGDQSAIEREDWALFRQTGVAHLMSISGLHVTMFAWLAAALIGRLWRLRPGLMLWLPSPTAALWGGVLAALAYAVFAGWGVPSQRTVWMLVTVALLKQLARQWPWPGVLLVAALVVCVIDPWALTQAGFWLSFLAVGLLMASGPDAAAPELQATSRWQRFIHLLRNTWHTQWVATLGLAPLSLILFQQLSLVGMAANLIAIPLVTLLITPLALLGAALPWCWHLAAGLVQGLSAALTALAALPWAVWQVPVAPLWAQGLGLLAGLLLVLPLPWRMRVLALPLALPFLWPQLPVPREGQFEVLAADVGQGTAVRVRTRHHVLLYDSGPAYGFDSNAGQRVLLPLLLGRGESTVDVLMLSHRDTDHVGGAASLLQGLKVQALHTSLEPEHRLLKSAVPHTRCEVGQHWVWDGVRFEVLHPAADFYDQPRKPNTLSCVLKVSAPGQSLLLTGDLEAAQELALVARLGEGLQSQVLMVPHHGSKTSSTAAFLDAVKPQVAVVQAGYRNRFGHPAAVVMARYEERGIQRYTSADCGAWLWDGTRMQCERERRRRYWHAAPVGNTPVAVEAEVIDADAPESPAPVESPL